MASSETSPSVQQNLGGLREHAGPFNAVVLKAATEMTRIGSSPAAIADAGCQHGQKYLDEHQLPYRLTCNIIHDSLEFRLHLKVRTPVLLPTKDDYWVYFSERDIPLIYHGAPPEAGAVLTMENYMKWYSIYRILPGGVVERVEYEEYAAVERGPKGSNTWCDHIPNPEMLDLIEACLGEGVEWCQESRDMIVGRHRLEIMNYCPVQPETPT